MLDEERGGGAEVTGLEVVEGLTRSPALQGRPVGVVAATDELEEFDRLVRC